MRGVLLTAAIAAALSLPARASGGDCDALAELLGEAAARKAVKRVAVAPFMGPRGASSYAGAVLSERLAAALLARGGLELIERPLLEAVLKEQKLGLFGIMEPHTAKTLGRVLGVDAILTGTAIELRGDKYEINARLIDAETARVLAAATARVPKDWVDPSGSEDGVSAFVVPVPSFSGEAAVWRDSVADGPACAERERTLERSLMDYKARFWAQKLKDPSFSPRQVTRNPGSEIRDPELRAEFYELVKKRYYEEPEPLTPREREALANGLEELRRFSAACGS